MLSHCQFPQLHHDFPRTLPGFPQVSRLRCSLLWRLLPSERGKGRYPLTKRDLAREKENKFTKQGESSLRD